MTLNARFAAEQMVVARNGRVAAARPAAAAGVVGMPIDTVLGMNFGALATLARDRKEYDSPVGRLRLEVLFDEGAQVDAILVTRERSRTRTELPIPAPSRVVRNATELAGADRASQRAVELAMRLAEADLTVLLTAEAGLGVDILVREMHARSGRKAERLCHLRFEGMTAQRSEDALELALEQTGTVFLEGVQRLSPLLLQQFVNRLDHGVNGSRRLILAVDPVDQEGDPLTLQVAASLARHSTVLLPPVRDREDLPALVQSLLRALRPGVSVGPEALRRLAQYSFPGNLTELQACLEFAVTVASPMRGLEAFHLPPSVVADRAPASAAPGGTSHVAEREALLAALRDAGGNASDAARTLGIARSTLYRWMRNHGVER